MEWEAGLLTLALWLAWQLGLRPAPPLLYAWRLLLVSPASQGAVPPGSHPAISLWGGAAVSQAALMDKYRASSVAFPFTCTARSQVLGK